MTETAGLRGTPASHRIRLGSHVRVIATSALVLAAVAGTAWAARVELETAPAAQGGLTVLIATLRDAGAGARHAGLTIELPAGVRVRATSLGKPECLALCHHDYTAPWRVAPVIGEHNERIGKACYFGAAVGFAPPGCDPLLDCTGVRLFDFDFGRSGAIPDGADLLQCTLEIAAAVGSGSFPLTCAAELSDAASDDVAAAECRGASLAVLCQGDCDGDGLVTIGEVIGGIAAALGDGDAASCPAIDGNRDGVVSIAEIIRARVNLLLGCDYVPPTPPPTPTPTPGPVTFAPPQHLHAGPYPAALAIADLHVDSRPDLVVALQPDHGVRPIEIFPVALLFGYGDGTFTAPSTVHVGNTPESIVVADFNRDRQPDVATGNFNAPFTVSVLLGRGDGAFDAQAQYPVGARPAAIVAADLDADGVPDLVTANLRSNDLSILYGRGDGTFEAEMRLDTCAAADLVAGDFSGDGRVDVVAAGAAGVCLHRNRRGLLQAAEPLSQLDATALAAGSFDGDGHLDLATVDGERNQLRVRINNGDGTFRAAGQYDIEGGPADVAAGDLTSDGIADLVTANYEGRDVAVLVNDGHGMFAAPHRVSVGRYSLPHELALADLDRDGRTDVVTINANTRDVTVLRALSNTGLP